mgnify:CR=1 FL=1|tara:strand:+ start:26319 stop:26546 length:228 start_codon:yes stop_codon:yes gene_type:complete
MKKIKYKFLVAFLFSVFATLAKLLWQDGESPIETLFSSQLFWTSFLLFFVIGYVLLGNILWAAAHKKSTIKKKVQ